MDKVLQEIKREILKSRLMNTCWKTSVFKKLMGATPTEYRRKKAAENMS